MSEIDEAMQDLTNVIELNPHDRIAYTDKECLHAITKAISIFKKNLSDEEQKSAIEKLTVTLTKLISIDSNNPSISSKNIVSRTHAQIIPNVKRIKLEKLRIVAYLKFKEKSKYIAELKGEKYKVSNNYKEVDTDLVSRAEDIIPYSYYKENIFSEEDFYLYRGVMYFYAGEYEKARKDFEVSMIK